MATDAGTGPASASAVARLGDDDVVTLVRTLADGEEWLMGRILEYAVERDYTRYTSTLLEAWRLSIVGLTDAITLALTRSAEVPELGPDLDPMSDPVAAFGVEEAARHRGRGVNLAMFLGLFKYYRQCYDELLVEHADRFVDVDVARLYVRRVFDRTELAYTASWAGTSAEQQIRDLSVANRGATNEKNRLLTLVESLPVAAFLASEDGTIELMNHAAALLAQAGALPGQTHYGVQSAAARPDWLVDVISSLAGSHGAETELTLASADGQRTFLVHVSHMLDVSHKYDGYAVVLTDVTEDRQVRQELLKAATVFAGTRDGVVVLDSVGRVAAVNPAMTALLGWTPETTVGRPLASLLSASVPGGWARWIPDESEHWMGEVSVTAADGREVTGWLSLSLVNGASGESIGIFTDITPLKESQLQLEHLAQHDPLTGLVNRAELRSQLATALGTAEGFGQRVAVLFLDLDHFKEINDTLGHAVGDEVLAQVAERLRAATRGRDILGRLGGDEFMVIAEGLSRPEQAELVARKALSSLDRPVDVDGQDYAISASVGISVFPDDGRDVDELIRNADSAMYLAKASGRATYRRYQASLTHDMQQRLVMRTALRRDIDADALYLHYQPIVSLVDGRLTGVEALLRWTCAEFGDVSPEDFVPLIEDLGLMEKVGEWVLDRALAQLAEWDGRGVPVPLVAVNVAPAQLEDVGFTRAVLDALDRYDVAADRLQLEVTEGTMFRVRSRGAEVLRALCGHGVTVAIDDFGTGYSSLGRLQELPIHELKVDRSFVMPFTHEENEDAQAMVSAITTLAHALDLTVTVEGVEDLRLGDRLLEMGCDRAQGFAYAPPLPPDRVSQAAIGAWPLV